MIYLQQNDFLQIYNNVPNLELEFIGCPGEWVLVLHQPGDRSVCLSLQRGGPRRFRSFDTAFSWCLEHLEVLAGGPVRVSYIKGGVNVT